MLVCSTILALSKGPAGQAYQAQLAEIFLRVRGTGSRWLTFLSSERNGVSTVVEVRRLELLTSSLQSWRSTN